MTKISKEMRELFDPAVHKIKQLLEHHFDQAKEGGSKIDVCSALKGLKTTC